MESQASAFLKEPYEEALKWQAAPGIDGATWRDYEKNLEDRLPVFACTYSSGSYRAKPSKRTYIPKADSKMRPLGIAALEDKIVQQAIVAVLNMIYGYMKKIF